MPGRTPPPRTHAQQKEHERRDALAALDVAAMRAWAERYTVVLLGDDQVVLLAMHEVRVIDKVTPANLRRESIAWLEANHPDSHALEQIRRYPGAFRGPSYGKAKQ